MTQRIKELTQWTASVILVYGLLINASGIVIGQVNPASPKAEASKTQDDAAVRILEPGKPIDRELTGAQIHSYQIEFAAGEVILIAINQRGIDVATRLFAPDGKKVVDSNRAAEGDEPVIAIAETAGSYRLEVRSSESSAASGTYEARIVERRAATEQERAQLTELAKKESELARKQTDLQEAERLENQAFETLKGGTSYAALPRVLREKYYKQAVAQAERASAIHERVLGAEHPKLAGSLGLLATLSMAMGDYARAEQNYLRAHAIYEKVLAADDPNTIASLLNLASLYANKGDFAQAEGYAQRALLIYEKKFGADAPQVALPLENLASLYLKKGEYERAEQYYRRALAINEKAFGLNSAEVADSLGNLGTVYVKKGDYARGEDYRQRALAIDEKLLGNNHISLAPQLLLLSSLYGRKGDFALSEQFAQRALKIVEKAHGANHPATADFLDLLASSYIDIGEYVRAEPYYTRSLEIREKAFGLEHPEVADVLDSLSFLYEKKGDYARAEQSIKRALAIYEKEFGAEHIEYAGSLKGLARLYYVKKDYARAEQISQRVLKIEEKALGADNTAVAGTLNNLAILYEEKGDYARAEQNFRRALAITEKEYGAEHYHLATNFNNLAGLYLVRGDYARAEEFYLRALAVSKPLGERHPNLAHFYDNISGLYEAKGDIDRAVATRANASEISEYNLALTLAAGSEKQKLLYAATLSKETDATVSLHLRSSPNNLPAARLALTNILRRKGRSLDAVADQIGSVRRHLDSEGRALLDNLAATRAQLSTLILKGPGQNDSAEYKKAVSKLEAEDERLQAAISAKSVEFRVQTQPVTIEQIQQTIPADAALVEIISYQPFNAKAKTSSTRFGAARYAAYVLRPKGEPLWVDLGIEKDIDHDVRAFRNALLDERIDVKPSARALDERVMRPVRKLAGDAKHLIISPDGQLNLIPFGALVSERNRYLVEDYLVSYLSSGRDLPRLQAKDSSNAPPVIIANPRFDKASVQRTPTSASGEERSADFSLRNFEELKGTADEAQALSKIMPDAKLLTEAQATESALKQVSQPRILHIATHGFFLPNQSRETVKLNTNIIKKAEDNNLFQTELTPGENPLLRSGLAFAGANKLEGGSGEDGILTALETAGLDLWGTRLVVLSACRTGEGDVKNGDGVYGLRRALVLAGAESQVMSLWRVSDAATSDLMVEYYKQLKAGEGRAGALRRVQLNMLASEKWHHPYYWAAFIQSGEWKGL